MASNPLAPTGDPGLLPAAAAARPMQAGMEETTRALDGEAIEGRRAVRRVKRAGASSKSRDARGRGKHVDRTA
jgi:hypothetical protein